VSAAICMCLNIYFCVYNPFVINRDLTEPAGHAVLSACLSNSNAFAMTDLQKDMLSLCFAYLSVYSAILSITSLYLSVSPFPESLD
jgi:hypothetical protein